MSVPAKTDIIIAKVDLTVYGGSSDEQGIIPYVDRKGIQWVGRKKAGEKVGTFTGIQENGKYQIDYTMEYRVYPAWPMKAYNVYQSKVLWVKITEVTGAWDVGVDAPVKEPVPDSYQKDYTNYFLVAGAVGALLIKKIRR